jgi:cobalt-precorrin-7 (C5)-methyltransferase
LRRGDVTGPETTNAETGDPAVVAARAPESTGDPAVHAVGVGPGAPAFLTGRARDLIAAADVVVGFETVVDFAREAIDDAETDCLTCGYADEGETLAAFADRVGAGERGVALLMGDPNVSGYQFLGKVERAVDGPVRVVPGISSIQVAASRARTPMEDTTFQTLHVRGDVTGALDRLADDAGERHLIVIPRPYDWMPEDVAAFLLDRGAPGDLTAIVFERLTHDGESRTETTLAELAADAGGDGPDDTAFSDLSILVVRAPTDSDLP